MMNGATGKRFYYLLSSFARIIGFIALLIAYIVVKIVVEPSIAWLNILLLCLSLGGLVSGIMNLILCGMTATGYKQKNLLQIICFIITMLTGGLVGSVLSGLGTFSRVSDEEVEAENIIRIKK